MTKKLPQYLPLLLLVIVPLFEACDQSEIRKGYESVNGTEIYYKRMGTGEPVIIVHGGPVLEHGYLTPYFKPLSDNFELIYFDQRLSGRSSADVDTSDVRLDTFVEDIEGLRRAFNLKTIHLIGHSWGAFLAMNYAIKYPTNLRSLVLLNSMPASSELWEKEEQIIAQEISAEDSLQRQAILNSPLFRNNQPEAIEQLLILFFKNQFRDSSLADSLKFDIPDDYTTRGERFGNIMKDITEYDLHPELSKLKVPALLVYGSIEPAASMSGPRLQKTLPHSDLVIIEESGHFPFVERPEIFIQELEDFLKSN